MQAWTLNCFFLSWWFPITVIRTRPWLLQAVANQPRMNMRWAVSAVPASTNGWAPRSICVSWEVTCIMEWCIPLPKWPDCPSETVLMCYVTQEYPISFTETTALIEARNHWVLPMTPVVLQSLLSLLASFVHKDYILQDVCFQNYPACAILATHARLTGRPEVHSCAEGVMES